ncbi:MAG: hypothetical protein EHM20_06465 [Alphaproteobacteria bacterium]|nr:MAG: hypothetical protein EHM20_06465 [Alphaproteobacteria bacterium]
MPIVRNNLNSRILIHIIGSKYIDLLEKSTAEVTDDDLLSSHLQGLIQRGFVNMENEVRKEVIKEKPGKPRKENEVNTEEKAENSSKENEVNTEEAENSSKEKEVNTEETEKPSERKKINTEEKVENPSKEKKVNTEEAEKPSEEKK